MKKPTQKDKAELFDRVVDIANMAQITMNGKHLRAVIHAMDDYSYSHRVGNGEFSDSEQNKIINLAFWRLDDIIRNGHKNG
jgi:hypothetical protein